jgi:manganese transport protein
MSEFRGSIVVPSQASIWQKLRIFLGPGILVSIGYMDPGNWATDIEAGSKYGYNLLFVVLLSSLAAIFLQCMSLRVGLVTRMDLAQLCRKQFSLSTNYVLWVVSEIGIVATDIAEVLGCALAFKLLMGCSLKVGIAITALDTLIVLALQGKGFRRIEAIILGLVSTVGICYFVELWLVQPVWADVWRGLLPSPSHLQGLDAWYLAVGIVGATVMPHSLFLHSSIVQTRKFPLTESGKQIALRMNNLDTTISLFFAFLINAAILILAGAAFHATGHHDVIEIDQAYRFLTPIVGSSVASVLFGLALLAAGQGSTLTGTMAGQIVMDGFIKIRLPSWKRRAITRALALIPAFLGVWVFGDLSIGRLIVLSQVVLSMQLPLVIFPLIRFAADRQLMGSFRLSRWTQAWGWMLFFVITASNFWLVWQILWPGK